MCQVSGPPLRLRVSPVFGWAQGIGIFSVVRSGTGILPGPGPRPWVPVSFAT